MAIKKIKKLTLLFGVVLTLLTPIIGASAVFTGKAAAVVAPEQDSGSVSKADSATTGDRAAAWVLARSVGACLYSVNYPDISISSSDFTKGKWSLPASNPSLNLGEYTGVLVEGSGSDDGKVKCDKTIAKAVSTLGLDATTTLCAMGFTRQHGGSDCATGTGDFIPPSSMHSNEDAFGEAWDNFILSNYFGTSVANPSDKTQISAAYGNNSVLTDGMRYYIYFMEFKQGCGDGKGGGWSIKPWSGQSLDDQSYHLQWLDTSGDAINDDFVSSSKNKKSTDVTVDGNKLLDQTDFSGSSNCGNVAAAMNKYATAYTAADVQDKQDGKTPASAPQPGTTGVDCGGWNWEDITTLTISWITCPVIKGAAHLAGVLEDQIDAMLYVNTDQIFCDDTGSGQCSATSGSFEQAWNVVRIFALGLLGIAGLLMILSQGMGFEIFDAYTIKKTLPRILVAAIGITLSWRLLEFIVVLSNDLGVGIRGLMYAPFQGTADQLVLGGGAKALGAIFGIGGFLALGVLGGLSFILTALLAILLAFFTLVVRNILVILLLILAPLAIAAYILPNTEKYWKIWWDWFFRALLAFPIITAIIAAGHIFAGITSASGDSTLNSVVAFFAYFAPYFLIPAAFRMAGGALATLSGMANDRSRGAFDRLKNYRQNKAANNWNKMKNFDRFSERSRIGRGLNTALGAATNPTSLLGGASGVRARRNAHQTVQGAAMLKENKIFQANQNDDNFLLALADRRLAEQKLQEDRNTSAIATADMAKYAIGSEEYTEAANRKATADASINAREKGLSTVGQMNWFDRENRSTRLTALDALSKTGYQFATGEKGYQELRDTVQSIVGNDQQAIAQTMDSSQFNLKSAGRFDLGGINHGAGYDFETGIGKASGYTAGQGKKDTYIAGAQHYLGVSGSADEIAAHVMQGINNGSVSPEKVIEWHAKLIDAEHGAAGANKDEIIKQQQAIEMAIERSKPFSTGVRSQAEIQLEMGVELNKRRGRPEGVDPNHLQDEGH